jgi:hypothetical protein
MIHGPAGRRRGRGGAIHLHPGARTMRVGISIHIGVNEPSSIPASKLSDSEENAWKMAELASQAGYGAIHVLRGPQATRQAVGTLLADAVHALQPGDTLFVTFSGHGSRLLDVDGDEWDGWDETWCLHDAELIDDELAGYWRQLPAGARAVVVSDSCFAGGAGRPVPGRARGVKQAAQHSSSSVPRLPSHTDGIRASVLWLAAASEDRRGQEGMYTPRLLEVWKGGAFRGSYCDLHRTLSTGVRREMQENPQEPQLIMLGAPDPSFPLEVAFHLAR